MFGKKDESKEDIEFRRQTDIAHNNRHVAVEENIKAISQELAAIRKALRESEESLVSGNSELSERIQSIQDGLSQVKTGLDTKLVSLRENILSDVRTEQDNDRMSRLRELDDRFKDIKNENVADRTELFEHLEKIENDFLELKLSVQEWIDFKQQKKPLTAKKQQIYDGVKAGKTRGQIADEMGILPSGISHTLQWIRKKGYLL